MSTITDLLNRIADKELQKKLTVEVEKLTKNKKFGLVFEEHQPEFTPLWDVPLRAGCLAIKKNINSNIIYRVIKLSDSLAICAVENSRKLESIPISELVTIVEFGDPIYPSLQQIDVIKNTSNDSKFKDLWHILIEADNYHALQLLTYCYAGKIDCIYIDPPYNTGAKDWKYNNNYVDNNDSYWRLELHQTKVIKSKLLFAGVL